MENTKVDTPKESTAVRLVLTESNYKRQFGNIKDPSRVLVTESTSAQIHDGLLQLLALAEQ